MIVDFRKLANFVKIIDAGSISRAAALLNTAQPALSQQLAALEQHFGQKLLLRSNSGISPTQAGLVLYRHAQFMLKYLDQATLDVERAGEVLTGHVSVGLATYSASSTLSLPIIREVRRQHPGITVHINDSFGQILSELVMSGRMDMAVIYASHPIKGTQLAPLFTEELYFVCGIDQDALFAPGAPIEVQALKGVPLVLPGKGHFLRKLIDDAFARARVKLEIAAEIESISALSEAVRTGIGGSILPLSVVLGIPGQERLNAHPLIKPAISADVALCTPDPAPMSEAALAVKAVLLQVVADLPEHAAGRSIAKAL